MATLQEQANQFADDFIDGANEVHKRSASDYVADASRPISEGGRMPVDTGELRDSINVNGSVGIAGFQTGIDSISVGGEIDVSWDALHAPFLEFGTSRIAARGVRSRGSRQVGSVLCHQRGECI